MYILTIRFKDLEPQEIRFQRKPAIHVENFDGRCWVFVNNWPYVWFYVEGWG